MDIDCIELSRLRVPLANRSKLSFGVLTHFDTILDRDAVERVRSAHAAFA